MNHLILDEKSANPAIRKGNKLIFSLKIAKKIVIALIVVIVFDFFLFAAPALASEDPSNSLNIEENSNISEELNSYENLKEVEQDNFVNSLPENSELGVIREGYHTITAYNSISSQTDGAPCLTANGFNLCEHGIEDSIAANFLKFGTKVRIPELFGDRVFVVRDRMHKRHVSKIDVWMLDYDDAKKFGVKIAKIEVLEGH